jgi:hypothetical protein
VTHHRADLEAPRTKCDRLERDLREVLHALEHVRHTLGTRLTAHQAKVLDKALARVNRALGLD